jgi:hypothetical protein
VPLGVATAAVLLAGTANAATGWVAVPGVDPSATGNFLTAVSARTDTDAWAVGTFANPADDAGLDGLAERWDGTRWQRFPVPSVLHFDEKLLAVGASGPNEAWALGSTNMTGFATTNPLAEHWNGTSWTTVPTAASTGGSKSIMDGVADLSPTNAWAVGRSRGARALVEHWDGTAWSIVTVPDPVPPAGNPLASSMLTGISAVSPTDIWAVGNFVYGGVVQGEHTLTMHYDGTAWSVVASPDIGGGTSLNPQRTELAGVAAAGPADVWAVGRTFNIDGGSGPAKVEVLHWNGRAWSFVADATGTAATALSSVSAGSPRDVWAVGGASSEHWNGSTWTEVALPGAAATGTLAGTSVVPGTGTAWAVGNNGGPSSILRHGA